jgi:hypothetical protein
LLLVFGIVLLLASGCGPGQGTTVTGKLVLPKDAVLESDDYVQISFLPEGAGGKSASGPVNATDLSFTINSAESQGVRPGKYKVSLQITPYQGKPTSVKRTQHFNDGINKQFSATTTRLSYEVTAGADNNITVDLVKGTVSKN